MTLIGAVPLAQVLWDCCSTMLRVGSTTQFYNTLELTSSVLPARTVRYAQALSPIAPLHMLPVSLHGALDLDSAVRRRALDRV